MLHEILYVFQHWNYFSDPSHWNLNEDWSCIYASSYRCYGTLSLVHGDEQLPRSIAIVPTDVIMGTIVSQIISLTIVYSNVYSDADQRKCQSSSSLASVRGIHRRPLNSPHKWPENVSIGWRHHRDTHWKYILDHHGWLQNSHSRRKLIKVTIFQLTKNAEFVLNTGI